MKNIAYVHKAINLFDTSIIEKISLKDKEKTDQGINKNVHQTCKN